MKLIGYANEPGRNEPVRVWLDPSQPEGYPSRYLTVVGDGRPKDGKTVPAVAPYCTRLAAQGDENMRQVISYSPI